MGFKKGWCQEMKARKNGVVLTKQLVESGVVIHVPATYAHLHTTGAHTPEFWLYVDAQKRTIVFTPHKASGFLKTLTDNGAIRVRVGESKVGNIVTTIRDFHINGIECAVGDYGAVMPSHLSDEEKEVING